MTIVTDEIAHETCRQFIMKTDAKLKALETIEKLYFGYYNTGQDTETFATEFFYTVGDILTGKSLKNLKLEFLLTEDLK